MQSTPTPKIEFRRQRDFGQLFTDVFKFLKLNFKSFFLCVLLIPGPLFLIAGGLYGYLQSIGSNPSSLISYGGLRDPWDLISTMMTVMLPYLFFAWLAALASSATINRFFVLYQERGLNNAITVSDIIKFLPGDMWRLFYNNLLLGLVLIGVFIGMFILALIPILGALVIVFTFLLAGPQMIYALVAGNYLVIRDKVLITSGIMKAWRYMRGNFWWTWVIVVVASIMVGVAGFIFGLPISIMGVANAFSRTNFYASEPSEVNTTLYIILGMIAIFGPQMLAPINTLFCVLTYHSYEEAEEGTGMKDKINEIQLDS